MASIINADLISSIIEFYDSCDIDFEINFKEAGGYALIGSIASLLHNDTNGGSAETEGLANAVFKIALVGEMEELNAVTEEFDVSDEEATNDIKEFLNGLEEAKLLK